MVGVAGGVCCKWCVLQVVFQVVIASDGVAGDVASSAGGDTIDVAGDGAGGAAAGATDGICCARPALLRVCGGLAFFALRRACVCAYVVCVCLCVRPCVRVGAIPVPAAGAGGDIREQGCE